MPSRSAAAPACAPAIGKWRTSPAAGQSWTELPPTTLRSASDRDRDLTNPSPRKGRQSIPRSQPEELILARSSRCPTSLVHKKLGSCGAALVAQTRTNSCAPAATRAEETSICPSSCRDGRPGRKNIHEILSEWVEFRIATVTRRSKFRLAQVDRRIHILEGRNIVLLNIDKVIRVIRESDEPKPELMKHFKLTEIQAEDILEIRLRQLARLEGIKIQNELKELKTERKGLKDLLGSDSEMLVPS